MNLRFSSHLIRRAARIGFVVGLLLSIAYIALRQNPFPLFEPPWATILYYPGIVAGWVTGMFCEQTLNLNLSPYIYTAIGCLAEALAWAFLFAALQCAGSMLRRARTH